VPFGLERWQSTWENRVRYNLSESGVHPLSIRELLTMAGSSLDALAEQRMVYSQSNGTDELRAAIAALYPGATEKHVIASVGSAEANFTVCWTLVGKGDKVTIVCPTYMQTWGLSENLGAKVTKLSLVPRLGWEPDLKAIKKAIPAKTKLVVLTNPNNPTGHVVSAESRQAILARAAEVGAWLLLDEVYQGAERNGGSPTPTLFGGYERAIAVNGLSKAYGLPGLRIGWVVAPPKLAEQVWSRHDYTVIGPGPANDFLARQALKVRGKIFERTRGILRANYPVMEAWLKQFDGLEWTAPDAGAICWVKYRAKVKSAVLVEQIRQRANILLCAGEHFGLGGYLRLGFGNDQAELKAALGVLAGEMKALK